MLPIGFDLRNSRGESARAVRSDRDRDAGRQLSGVGRRRDQPRRLLSIERAVRHLDRRYGMLRGVRDRNAAASLPVATRPARRRRNDRCYGFSWAGGSDGGGGGAGFGAGAGSGGSCEGSGAIMLFKSIVWTRSFSFTTCSAGAAWFRRGAGSCAVASCFSVLPSSLASSLRSSFLAGAAAVPCPAAFAPGSAVAGVGLGAGAGFAAAGFGASAAGFASPPAFASSPPTQLR